MNVETVLNEIYSRSEGGFHLDITKDDLVAAVNSAFGTKIAECETADPNSWFRSGNCLKFCFGWSNNKQDHKLSIHYKGKAREAKPGGNLFDLFEISHYDVEETYIYDMALDEMIKNVRFISGVDLAIGDIKWLTSL